jgi:hypothetical protein
MQNKFKINGLMYDNIRLTMPYNFESEHERDIFCVRFGLFVKDEKRGIWHNKGYEALSQNKGIYIRIEAPTSNKKGNISISLSLHKFYNKTVNNEYFNYNDFSFEHASISYLALCELMPLNIGTATVKAFEVGINIITPSDPDEFMKELSLINVKAREMRIIEDLHFKEYKQFSTHKDKDKRVIYIFYNKTFEAKSKIKDTEKRQAVPDNILRIEKDTHRPNEKILFSQLFDPLQQQIIKKEFEARFVSDLEYKSFYTKTKDVSKLQLEILQSIDNKGIDKTLSDKKEQLKQNVITKRQYQFFRETFTEITQKSTKPQKRISNKAETMKQLIISKLNEF